MIILGINCFHADSAAALVINGELRAAVEEERFRRIKHWSGFPSEAIKYCLEQAGCSLHELDVVAVNTDPTASLWRRLAFAVTGAPRLSLIREKLRARSRRLSVKKQLEAAFGIEGLDAKIVKVEHHLAHLASAFYPSDFDEAVAVSIDSFGDFASCAWGVGKGDNVSVDGRVYFPHSLGIFYSAMTQYIGFLKFGDEYKVMGLAPYGSDVYVDQLRKIVKTNKEGTYCLDMRFFRHNKESISFQFDKEGEPVVGELFSRMLDRELRCRRSPEQDVLAAHKDLARATQMVYEEVLFVLLRKLYQRYGVDRLVLSGGCAANSVANGKISRETPFVKTYVAAAAGDAGGAVGAALVAARVAGSKRCAPISSAYWGPSFDNEVCGIIMERHRAELEAQGCRVELLRDEDLLVSRTVDHLVLGHVVGWFNGRMEWGPRALGARSILADPRRADMKDILNQKIKRRESFRPFAPSVLREHVSAWFEVDADVPFMSHVLPIREDKRAQIPAVTHVDGSGRLQTVQRQENPRYYGLIEAFARRTGVPMLLNTSFNENEPIVCKPEEALDCFLRTKMDVLVLENWLVERNCESGES